MGLPTLPQEANFTPVKKPFINPYAVDVMDREVKNIYTWVHPNTGAFICNSGSKHKATNFVDRYEPFKQRVEESDVIDVSEITGAPRLYNNGTVLQARFNLKKYDMQKVLGEPAGVRMTYRDSHDQSCKSSVSVEILRLACTNGMLSIANQTTIASKHTTFDNAKTFSKKITEIMDNVFKEAELMRTMQHQHVSTDKAMDFLENVVASSKRDLERVEAIYHQYSHLGNTGYRMLQVVTHLSSHLTDRQQKSDNVFNRTLALENRSQNILQSKEFKNLCIPEPA